MPPSLINQKEMEREREREREIERDRKMSFNQGKENELISNSNLEKLISLIMIQQKNNSGTNRHHFINMNNITITLWIM